MQWANVGIHLDRDTWSAENIEQREGRLWRHGQTRKVSFYNIDWMFNDPKDDFDYTLDQVRSLYEKVGSETFHDIVVVPQSMELGGEWGGLRNVDDLRIDRSSHPVRDDADRCPSRRELLMESPRTLAEWQAHIASLSGEQLYSEARAANTVSFVRQLQAEAIDVKTIHAILRAFAERFAALGERAPTDGFYDFADLLRTDTR